MSVLVEFEILSASHKLTWRLGYSESYDCYNLILPLDVNTQHRNGKQILLAPSGLSWDTCINHRLQLEVSRPLTWRRKSAHCVGQTPVGCCYVTGCQLSTNCSLKGHCQGDTSTKYERPTSSCSNLVIRRTMFENFGWTQDALMR